MNLLVLYQSPWWNAAAYYSYNLVKALNDNNHKVIFVGSKDSPAAKKISELGVHVNNLNLLVSSPFRFISNIGKTKNIIESENIDLVIPISAQGHIITGILRKFYNKNIPVIKVCLDNVPPTNNVFNRYLHNKLTEYFIFPGIATKFRYDKIFRIKNFNILHAPIELDKFIDFKQKENLKEELGIPNNKVIVSFIGRFAPEKGIFFLLEIIKKVINQSDNVFFILSGEEGLIKFDDINNRLKEYNIQNDVKLVPQMNDVRDLISITDAGILSSRYSEYICRIALEFMAFGRPVIAPELNVIPEVVINNETGYLYEIEDSTKAAELILNLLEKSDVRKQLGVNAYKRIKENYTLNIFSEELEEIIKKIMI